MEAVMSRVHLVSAVTTCLALFAGIGGAHAQALTQRIEFGDLDLAQPHDAKAFAHRVDAAGDTLCRQLVSQQGVAYLAERKLCMASIREEAFEALPPAQQFALARWPQPRVASERWSARTGM
jgi:UrcA family protein